jgi:hypothetical protein
MPTMSAQRQQTLPFADAFSAAARRARDAVKIKAADRIKQDPELASAISAFMFLGSQRNLIVHRNMLAFALASTSDEIIARRRGRHFVSSIS